MASSPSSAVALWERLRVIERRIQRRDIARALAQLNFIAGEVEGTSHPAVTAFFRCIIGDAEYKQGRFPEAIAAYGLVRSEYPAHLEGRLLLRGSIGEVLSLLKRSEVAIAQSRAIALVEAASIPRPVPEPPANGAPVAVHTVLPPAPLVAARLAGFFRREGFKPEAAALLALAPPSQDHVKARQERAETLARSGDPAGAESLILVMMQNASTRNRTLSGKAWQILLKVRQEQNKPLLLQPEAIAIGAIPGKRLRARIALAVIHQLRQAGDLTWKTWLQTWGLTNPPVPADARLAAARLLLAEVRRERTNFSELRRLADAIMANPKVTVDDYIAAAKAALFAAYKGAGAANPQAVANTAARKFGPSAKITTLHSLARTALDAGQPAVALTLFQKVRQEASPKARRRSKATYSLAVLQMQQGNYAAAATLSGELADDTALSPEFRLLALDRQCTALRHLGSDTELAATRAKVDTLIPANLPPSTLIRMARFSRLSGEWGSGGLYAPLLERAVIATLQAVATSAQPGPALTVLLELTRKLYWDFYEHQQVFTIWQNLGPERREWLWTERSAFWEYVSLVIRACGKLHRSTDVQALANMATQDAPPEALPFTATALGDYYRENHRWAEAFEAYSHAVKAQPTHLECARAYYWLGLRARWEGRTADALAAMQALRRAFGNAVSLLWHWELDARALLLLNARNPAAVAALSRYDLPFLSTQLAALQADEAAISA